MYECICVCNYVSMYACMQCTYTHIQIHICMNVNIHMCIHTHTHKAPTYMHVCIHTCMYAYMPAYMPACMHACMHHMCVLEDGKETRGPKLFDQYVSYSAPWALEGHLCDTWVLCPLGREASQNWFALKELTLSYQNMDIYI